MRKRLETAELLNWLVVGCLDLGEPLLADSMRGGQTNEMAEVVILGDPWTLMSISTRGCYPRQCQKGYSSMPYRQRLCAIRQCIRQRIVNDFPISE